MGQVHACAREGSEGAGSKPEALKAYGLLEITARRGIYMRKGLSSQKRSNSLQRKLP